MAISILVFIVAAIAGVASLVAVIYPYRPFGTRKRAFVSFIVCAVAFLASPFFMATTVSTEGQSSSRVEATVVSETTETPVVDTGPRPLETDEIEKALALIESQNFDALRTRLNELKRDGYETDEILSIVEERTLAEVKPLPASDIEQNLAGYMLLVAVRPENEVYTAKVDEYLERRSRARMAPVRKLRTKEDKVDGVTWYQHPNQPKYINSRSTAYLYIGKKGSGQIWLRMQVQYTASDWLFVESVDAWHDGVKETLISGSFERDNNTEIWEWRDVVPNANQIRILEDLANSNEAILRFNGAQYRRDVTLSKGDKQAILDVIAAYNALGAH